MFPHGTYSTRPMDVYVIGTLHGDLKGGRSVWLPGSKITDSYIGERVRENLNIVGDGKDAYRGRDAFVAVSRQHAEAVCGGLRAFGPHMIIVAKSADQHPSKAVFESIRNYRPTAVFLEYDMYDRDIWDVIRCVRSL